jgi:chromosome segregation ATPase
MVNEKKYENASLTRENKTLNKNVADLTTLNVEKDQMCVMLEEEVLGLKNNIADLNNELDDSNKHIDEQNFQMEDLVQQCKHWEAKYEHENTVLIQTQNDVMELQSQNANLNNDLEAEQKRSNFFSSKKK